MSNIVDLMIHEKMSNLSIITTLTIDIQKELHNWNQCCNHSNCKVTNNTHKESYNHNRDKRQDIRLNNSLYYTKHMWVHTNIKPN